MMSTNGDSRAAAPNLADPSGDRIASLSPSLAGACLSASGGPAYELKFLLNDDQAREMEGRLMDALLPDPHADPTLGGMYAVTSLACDSPDLGVFYRDARMRNRKYRVRRYGASETVYLERKRSRQGRVKKRRAPALGAGLGDIVTGKAGDASHGWFVRELSARELAPVCRIRYLRRALFGTGPDGAMRVTFDRRIRASLAPGWSLDFDAEERPLLEGVVVCEFKFHSAMPGPLKAIVADMHLEAMGVSKYRACIRAFSKEVGIDPSRDPACTPAANGDAGVGHA
jgi:hypothetical protein